MDQRDGPICNSVRRALSGVSELTPWGQFADPQPSQRPILHKTSDIPCGATAEVIDRLIASLPFSRIDIVRAGHDPRLGVTMQIITLISKGRAAQENDRGHKHARKRPFGVAHIISHPPFPKSMASS